MKLQASLLHRQSRELLQQAENPKKLVLIHTAVAVGGSLLVAVLNYFLSLQIENTGGLSGIGLRSVLETVQSVLELIIMIAMPFWEIGLIYAGLKWIEGEKTGPSTLLQGFRRFAAVLRFRILYSLIFMVIGTALINICTTLFLLTPYGTPLVEQLSPILDASLTAQQIEEMFTTEAALSLAKSMLPLMILCAVVFLPVAIGVFYRLRLAEYGVMDGFGARKSLSKSFRATKKNVWQLMKIDLHFWWFYVLQGLCIALCYGDQILHLAGVSLPMTPDGAFFLFYTLGMVLQGVLIWQYQGQLLGAYCLAYRELTDEPATQQ